MMLRTAIGVLALCTIAVTAEVRKVNPAYEAFDFGTWKLGVVFTPKLLVTDATQEAFEEVAPGRRYDEFVREKTHDYFRRNTTFLDVVLIDSLFELEQRCENTGRASVCLQFPRDLSGMLRATGCRFVLVMSRFSTRAGRQVVRRDDGVPLRTLTKNRGEIPAEASFGTYAEAAHVTIYNGVDYAVYDTRDQAFVTVGTERNKDTVADMDLDDWEVCLERCLDEIRQSTGFRADW